MSKSVVLNSKFTLFSAAIFFTLTSSLFVHGINVSVVQVCSDVRYENIFELDKSPVEAEGRGSAFCISSDGYFLTNYHVVACAKNVHIKIPSCGKTPFKATVKSIAPDHDVALLKVDEEVIADIEKKLGKVYKY